MAQAAEAAMPTGGRPRQLCVRSLLVGILLALGDDRPAQLVRVHEALVGLGPSDQARLGVVVAVKNGRHLLTYRQVERTFNTWIKAMDATAGDALGVCLDAILEATIPAEVAAASASVAVDWTDLASWARPRPEGESPADADASWGHRNVNTPGTKTELFFGYYAQVLTMVPEETGPPIANLIRRVTLSAPNIDPVGVITGLITAMAGAGVRIADVLADAGYASRVASKWAGPLRAAGAGLVVDRTQRIEGPRAASKEPSSPTVSTATSTARRCPKGWRSWGRRGGDGVPTSSPPMTAPVWNSASTSWAGSAPMTPRAITASPVRPRRESCAVR
ncbi:MAG TPA: hypothetical protein VNF50_11765 [Acidimicrobiales bacterium]|nr:hypothetical protein [Acidimicrobiales bacterium]